MITPQLVFMVAGIVLLVTSFVLLVVALVYYVRNDIRGVRDDLAGRTRRGEGATRDRRAATRRRSNAGVARTSVGRRAAGVPDDLVADAQPEEDQVETVIDTKLHGAPQNAAGISSDAYDVNDDIPTLVTSVGDYHQTNMSDKSLNDADVPTLVEEGGEGVAARRAGDDAPSFVVTKSILAIHSNEIITVG